MFLASLEMMMLLALLALIIKKNMTLIIALL